MNQELEIFLTQGEILEKIVLNCETCNQTNIKGRT